MSGFLSELDYGIFVFEWINNLSWMGFIIGFFVGVWGLGGRIVGECELFLFL